MHLGNALITLLASATLSTVVSAAAVDTALVPRSGPFDGLKAKPATLKKLSNYCLKANGHPQQRDLVRRNGDAPAGYTDVQTGGAEGAKLQKGLWTNDLMTCFAVGIVGKPKSEIEDERFLAHFLCASEALLNLQWEKFSKMVKAADLKDAKAWMSIPDPKEDTPEEWDEDLTNAVYEMEGKLTGLVHELIGNKPPVPTHRTMGKENPPKYPKGTMWITPKNEIFIEGHHVGSYA
ncbi:MAG: hypothetical protein M1821_006624 [Bathelium mastoideum]|nr:MAG: hypothetical protein M1821_006624 [Bathelium mastoideum]